MVAPEMTCCDIISGIWWGDVAGKGPMPVNTMVLWLGGERNANFEFFEDGCCWGKEPVSIMALPTARDS